MRERYRYYFCLPPLLRCGVKNRRRPGADRFRAYIRRMPRHSAGFTIAAGSGLIFTSALLMRCAASRYILRGGAPLHIVAAVNAFDKQRFTATSAWRTIFRRWAEILIGYFRPRPLLLYATRAMRTLTVVAATSIPPQKVKGKMAHSGALMVSDILSAISMA